MRGFVWLVTVEIYPIWASPQNGRHIIEPFRENVLTTTWLAYRLDPQLFFIVSPGSFLKAMYP